MATVFACGPKDALFEIDVTGDVVTFKLDGQTVLGEQQAAITDTAALTSNDMPAGGTGATAGAYDTAGNRDTAIAEFAALRVDVAATNAKVDAILAALRAHGIIAT